MLTKAFVVLVTVLAILLVALTVSSVAQYENLQASAENLQREIDRAGRAAQRDQTQLANAQAEYAQRLEMHRGEVRQLTQQNETLASELRQARAAANDAEADLERWEASLERLAAAEALNSTQLASLNEELDRRREQSVELQTRLVESASRVAELSTAGDSLEREVRRMREQMQASMEARRETEELLASLPREVREQLTGSEGARGGQVPEEDIAGRIEQVRQVGGDVLVQVNVGRNDGVSEGMAFMVYRDQEFLARLVIDSLEADTAVGHLELIQDDVHAGDSIFASSR